MKLVLISARGEQEPPSFPNEFPYHGEFHQTKRDTLCMYADPRVWVSGSEQAEVGSVSCCDPTRELASGPCICTFDTLPHTRTHVCALLRTAVSLTARAQVRAPHSACLPIRLYVLALRVCVSCCDPTRELASGPCICTFDTLPHTHAHTCARSCGLQCLLPRAHRLLYCLFIRFNYTVYFQ